MILGPPQAKSDRRHQHSRTEPPYWYLTNLTTYVASSQVPEWPGIKSTNYQQYSQPHTHARIHPYARSGFPPLTRVRPLLCNTISGFYSASFAEYGSHTSGVISMIYKHERPEYVSPLLPCAVLSIRLRARFKYRILTMYFEPIVNKSRKVRNFRASPVQQLFHADHINSRSLSSYYR